MGLGIEECLFVAVHGWDVAGAGWVGMKTAFLARPGHERFPLGPPIDIVETTIEGLAEALRAVAMDQTTG